MIHLKLFVVGMLLSLGCSGPPPPRWPSPLAAGYSAPLFEAYTPRAVLVEAYLDDRPTPLLFAVELATRGAVLRRQRATQLGLYLEGDPRREAPHITARLTLGDLVLEGVRFQSVDRHLGQVAGRPIDGILGADVFVGATLKIDLRTGWLRLERGATPAVEASRARVATLELAVGDGDTTHRLLISTANWIGLLDPAVAAKAGLEVTAMDPSSERPISWHGPVRLPGGDVIDARFVRSPAPPGAPAGTEGVLGFEALSGRSIEYATQTGELALKPTLVTDVLTRFAQLDACGPKLSRCLSGRITTATSGHVELSFDEPQAPLPKGYWLRVALHQIGSPSQTVLVRLEPGRGAARTLALDRASLSPRQLSPVGSPLRIVDVIPLRAHCPAQACLR